VRLLRPRAASSNARNTHTNPNPYHMDVYLPIVPLLFACSYSLPPFLPLWVNTPEHDQVLEALKARVSSCYVATLYVYLLHTGNTHDVREAT
jgi:hypothetical protein